MAKKQKNLPKPSSTFSLLSSQAQSAERYRDKHRDDPHCSWKEKEALLLGRNMESTTNTQKSQIFDPRLSTVVFERASRVMAQHATGKVQAIDDKNDKAKNIMMDLIMQKYIIPHADSQFDLLTKFRMLDLYSLVYGSQMALIDYRVDDDYIGPDMWLIPMRHYLPEPNSTTIQSANYGFVDAWVTRDWLESRPKSGDWKNIDKILEEVDAGNYKKSEYQSYSEELYQDNTYGGKGKYAMIHVRTRYERDHWTTYCPDFSGLQGNSIIRDVANKHGNNEIPIVKKDAFPLIDRFYGLGDFERGKTIQYAINSLWNLFLDGQAMKLYPPVVYHPGSIVNHTMKYTPGAKWALTTNQNAFVPKALNLNPGTENSFQSTFQVLVASLLNQAGTTDTSVTKQTDPGLGKTPAALEQIKARESARDNWDRFLMEQTVERSMNIMIDLLCTKQEKPIDVELFKSDIDKITKMFPDQSGEMMEVFESGQYGKMTVKNKDIKSKYRFSVDAGTTMKKDDAKEHQNLVEIMTTMLAVPGIAQQVPQGKVQIGTKVVDFGEMLERFIVTSGVQDYEKIVEDMEENQEGGQSINFDMNQFAESSPEVQQLAQQIAGQGGMPQQPGVPQMGGMNV